MGVSSSAESEREQSRNREDEPKADAKVDKSTVDLIEPSKFQQHILDNFFDPPSIWAVHADKTGRPWSQKELKNKSADDIHSLWYTLLKERNKILTMIAEYEDRLSDATPGSERLEKVEQSMEAVLDEIEDRKPKKES